MTILVGGVSQLYQGDLDVGRRAVVQLEDVDLGADVLVEDLFYGAIAVAQRLEELRPEVFLLVGAERRGRPPGTVERRDVEPAEVAPDEFQAAVADAGTGWVSMDLLVTVATGMQVLPARTTAFEIEPVTVAPSEQLSPQAANALERAVELVRAEVRRCTATARSTSDGGRR